LAQKGGVSSAFTPHRARGQRKKGLFKRDPCLGDLGDPSLGDGSPIAETGGGCMAMRGDSASEEKKRREVSAKRWFVRYKTKHGQRVLRGGPAWPKSLIMLKKKSQRG